MNDSNIYNILGYLASGSLIVFVITSIISSLGRWLAIRERQRTQVKNIGEEVRFSDLEFDNIWQRSELSSRINTWVGGLTRNPKYGARLRQKLLRAGIFDPNAVGAFILARITSPIALSIPMFLSLRVLLPNASSLTLFGLPMATALMGAFLPDYYLARRTRLYEDECRRGFPDFLDLLVVATDAGMGVEQAINRVGSEIITNYPRLGANLYLMTLELRMGRGFSEALGNLVTRTNVDEIRNFVTLIQQSRELGSSITAALRIYSEDMRHKRMSKAEEKAYALPAKMVIPLALFLFPVVVLIIMLPVAIRISEAFTKVGN